MEMHVLGLGLSQPLLSMDLFESKVVPQGCDGLGCMATNGCHASRMMWCMHFMCVAHLRLASEGILHDSSLDESRADMRVSAMNS